VGWDVITYKDRHQIFNDFDLATLRHFLLRELETYSGNDADSVALKEYLAEWEWLCPGVVMGTEPDGYLGESAERKKLLLELVDRTVKRISAFGSEVSLDYFERHVNTAAEFRAQGARYTQAQPVSSFLDALEKYKKLIEG
jgi:hypothetical protein